MVNALVIIGFLNQFFVSRMFPNILVSKWFGFSFRFEQKLVIYFLPGCDDLRSFSETFPKPFLQVTHWSSNYLWPQGLSPLIMRSVNFPTKITWKALQWWYWSEIWIHEVCGLVVLCFGFQIWLCDDMTEGLVCRPAHFLIKQKQAECVPWQAGALLCLGGSFMKKPSSAHLGVLEFAVSMFLLCQGQAWFLPS